MGRGGGEWGEGVYRFGISVGNLVCLVFFFFFFFLGGGGGGCKGDFGGMAVRNLLTDFVKFGFRKIAIFLRLRLGVLG